MIVIDSSAVIASVMREADEERYIVAIRAVSSCLLSAANYLECAMVLTRLADGRKELDDWLNHFKVEVVPVGLAQARLAVDAFERFGRGQHPARLNYGDCFAYALAASRGAPLLYKGTDFGKTDVASALAMPP